MRTAVGAAIAERRRIESRPHAGAARHHQDDPSLRREHPPHLPQHRPDALGGFQAMDGEQLVDGAVGQRQVVFLDEHRLPLRIVRPRERALLHRHERADPQRFTTKRTEIGRREPEADDGLAFDVPPARAQPVQQDAPHDLPERGEIEVPQICDVEIHPVSGSVASRPTTLAYRQLNRRARLAVWRVARLHKVGAMIVSPTP
jgi:hypothetical protein